MFVASEGWCNRYEILSLRDGYLVQMRDVATGNIEREFSTLFRTLPVAVAYAVMSAAYERFAELEAGDDGFLELEAELEDSEQHFMELSDKLCDIGLYQGTGEEAPESDADSQSIMSTYH